jgi:hypothetical protein
MSDTSQGPGWWLASDGKWYPPNLSPGWPSDEPALVSTAASSPFSEATAPQSSASAFEATTPSPVAQGWTDDWSLNRAPDVRSSPGSGGSQYSPARSATASKRRGRRKLIAAVITVVVLLGAGGAAAMALTSPSSPSLGGKSPAQVLQTTLAAADKAGAFQATQSQSDNGQSSTSTIYVGPNGATVSSVDTGVNVDLKLVLVDGKVYAKASALFWSALLNSNVNSKLLGHWIEVPPSNADLSKLVGGLNLTALVSSLVALRSPLSETSSGSGSAGSVNVQGTLPDTPINAGDGSGDVATVRVSTTAPFYPLGISFDDKKNGPATVSFSNWGTTQALPSTAGAVPMSLLKGPSPKHK